MAIKSTEEWQKKLEETKSQAAKEMDEFKNVVAGKQREARNAAKKERDELEKKLFEARSTAGTYVKNYNDTNVKLEAAQATVVTVELRNTSLQSQLLAEKNQRIEAEKVVEDEKKSRTDAEKRLIAYHDDSEKQLLMAKKLYSDHKEVLEFHFKDHPDSIRESVVGSLEFSYGLLKGAK